MSVRTLPDGELSVMQALWACTPPVSRTEIAENLSHNLAPTTLLTVLNRLAEKGFVSIEKRGRQCFYTPLVAEHDYLAQQSHCFFQKLCGGSPSTFASALCDSGISAEDLAELRRLLEEDVL